MSKLQFLSSCLKFYLIHTHNNKESNHIFSEEQVSVLVTNDNESLNIVNTMFMEKSVW
jgi:hypothetical protein